MNFLRFGRFAELRKGGWRYGLTTSADCGAPATSPRHPPDTHGAYALLERRPLEREKASHKRQRFSVDWKTLHNGLICP